MSSHFDDCDGRCTDGAGIAPGADDNASSVAAVLKRRASWRRRAFAARSSSHASTAKSSALGFESLRARTRCRPRARFGLLNDDIIGNSVGGDGRSEPTVVRVFSEGVASGGDIERVNLVGSENDSPSRELSRFIAEVVPVYVPDSRPPDLPIGPLPARRRSRIVPRRGLRGSDTLRRSARELHASASRRARRRRRAVRRSSAVYRRAVLARATQANVAALATLALGPAPPAPTLVYHSSVTIRRCDGAGDGCGSLRDPLARHRRAAVGVRENVGTVTRRRLRFRRTITFWAYAASTPAACAAPSFIPSGALRE